jgi:threonine synthase
MFSKDDIRAMRGQPYPEVAYRVMQPFVGGTVPDAVLKRICDEVYGSFEHVCAAPLKQMRADLWLMELFHGPTFAFKDYAMQVLGRLFDYVLAERDERVTIIGATSGDTGSAAMEACRDRDRVDCFILFPKGRVSPIQQRQMTTVDAPNIHAIEIEGTFDDCQDLVKAAFGDQEFREGVRLSAVNSINWARIMPQIAYYFWAAVQLGAPDRQIAFSVPTGNFGNVFAAYAARQMGLPVGKLVIGTNSNDILHRFFETGTMEILGVEPTLSPSMDIQVSSNFERFLFDMLDRDAVRLTEVMTAFRRDLRYEVPADKLEAAKTLFESHRIDDEAIVNTIRTELDKTGELLDPHSAIGVASALAAGDLGMPIVSLACAHPAKFEDAVRRAIGQAPALPARLAALMDLPEKSDVMPNDLGMLKDFISKRTRAQGAPA